jgi:hypothetical protein
MLSTTEPPALLLIFKNSVSTWWKYYVLMYENGKMSWGRGDKGE